MCRLLFPPRGSQTNCLLAASLIAFSNCSLLCNARIYFIKWFIQLCILYTVIGTYSAVLLPITTPSPNLSTYLPTYMKTHFPYTSTYRTDLSFAVLPHTSFNTFQQIQHQTRNNNLPIYRTVPCRHQH